MLISLIALDNTEYKDVPVAEVGTKDFLISSNVDFFEIFVLAKTSLLFKV